MKLLEILEDRGIQYTKVGRLYRAFCPAHEDTKNPNMYIYPNDLAYCFCCRKTFDAIEMVRILDRCSYSEAKEKLYGINYIKKVLTKPSKKGIVIDSGYLKLVVAKEVYKKFRELNAIDVTILSELEKCVVTEDNIKKIMNNISLWRVK